MKRQRREDRRIGVNDRLSKSERMGKCLSEMQEMNHAMRPGEVAQPVLPEHDPMRHLTDQEREEILSKIVPAQSIQQPIQIQQQPC